MKEEIICGIYMITSPSGKIYIGQSIYIYHRWEGHRKYKLKYKDKEKNSKLHNSFNKYGVENHKFEIILICKEEFLNDMERYYIKLYDTYGTAHGLNHTEGGDGCRGLKWRDDSRERLSKIQKGVSKNKGVKHTEQSKKNMSEAQRKRHETWVMSEETRKKKSESMKGKNKRKHTKEEIAKQVATRKANHEKKKSLIPPKVKVKVPLLSKDQIREIYSKAAKLLW